MQLEREGDYFGRDASREEKPLNRQAFRIATVAIIVLLTAIPFPGCGPGNKEPAGSDSVAGTHVIPVEVAVASRSDLAVTKTYSGTLEGEDQANIIAKLSERVTGVKVRIGESVPAGHVTVTLDKSGPSSQYFQAEASFKNAEKTLERMKSLYAEGAVSLQTLDGAQTAFDVAKANFDAARSTVELTTPISGVVTAVNVSVGDLPTPGFVLATVAKVARMKVIFNINESDVTNLAIGQRVRVYTEVRPEEVVEGQISQISRSADVRSRSFEVKAAFQNTSDRLFKPGMFVKVDVRLAPRDKALVIPNAAILSDGVTNRVFVVKNGRSYQQTIQLGVTDGERTEVLQGLVQSDTVATTGATNLKDSSVVNVIRR